MHEKFIGNPNKFFIDRSTRMSAFYCSDMHKRNASVSERFPSDASGK